MTAHSVGPGGTPEDRYGTKRDKFAEGAELTECSVTMVFGIDLGAYCCPYPSSQ